jgi:hypothetical protein
MSIFRTDAIKYKIMLQNSISLCVTALNSVRLNHHKDIDLAIKAVDQVQKYLPELRRALIYYKNTGVPDAEYPTLPPIPPGA